ncbi:MAG TPA: DnaA N-terminal domain-containing protein, partial [Baekduia sp.]|nr:DnaA N-terminal domain-containing protein [Baekduia sp.]
MTPDPAPIWTRLQAELRHRVPESTYDVWLAPLRWGGLDGERLVVLAPADVRAWVQQRFVGLLEDAARGVVGAGATVELRDDDGSATPAAGSAPTPAGDPRAALFDDTVSRLNPKYTFEQFVIGDANRFAHAAALAVAELPG